MFERCVEKIREFVESMAMDCPVILDILDNLEIKELKIILFVDVLNKPVIL